MVCHFLRLHRSAVVRGHLVGGPFAHEREPGDPLHLGQRGGQQVVRSRWGGAVVDGISWQAIFWLNVPVALVAIPLVLRALPESYGRRSRLDLAGVLLAGAGVLSVVWGVVRGNDDGWTSAPVLGRLHARGAPLIDAPLDERLAVFDGVAPEGAALLDRRHLRLLLHEPLVGGVR